MACPSALDVQSFGRGVWSLHGRHLCSAEHLAVILTDNGDVDLDLSASRITTRAHDVTVAPWSSIQQLRVGDQARAIAILIPVAPSEVPQLAAGFTISSRRGATSGILRHILRGLADDAQDGAVDHSRRVLEQLIGIVRVVSLDRQREQLGGASGIYHDAIEVVEGRLWDQELDSDYVASRLNVSTRTLHRAFKARDTTMSGEIRERRLARCHDDLRDRQYSHIPVGEVAARWGLSDAAHFSRLFKARFGLAPRSFRTQAGLELRLPETEWSRQNALQSA